MEKANSIVIKATAMKHEYEKLKVEMEEKEKEVIVISVMVNSDFNINGHQTDLAMEPINIVCATIC